MDGIGRLGRLIPKTIELLRATQQWDRERKGSPSCTHFLVLFGLVSLPLNCCSTQCEGASLTSVGV